ncbi:uncharacterized protein LOC131212067 [Anopheles bellator]|uniref:uncharacterized protein LOC131212067 n=1 Tax=Anopheles bellator TaxID=139047 RepID=UPI0026472FE6|nr:uncharacterized protein LOC131212067 [Anopheles bellator]
MKKMWKMARMASTATWLVLILLLAAATLPCHSSVALPEGTFPIAKRMNIETCLVRFDEHLNTIIRTEESRSMGARFVDDADLNSREQCLRLCCETENCDVFVFEEKSPGTCFLFQCGPPENFRCKFTRHSNYTSAVLSIPTPPIEQRPPPLAAQIQSLAQPDPSKLLSQHEMELVSLKQGAIGTNSKRRLNSGLTTTTPTPLPPLGVRLGDIVPTATPTAPQQRKTQCGHFEFSCHSGECIAVYNVCDGIPQCEDGSDEGADCPQKNSASIVSSVSSASSGGGYLSQPGMQIGGANPIRAVGGSKPLLSIDSDRSRMYQQMDFPPPPPNRFVIESDQQQPKASGHRNREDPMTAPKPWPRPGFNEFLYADTPNSHIFSHKGGLHLSAMPSAQQYQESAPESSYLPASPIDLGGAGSVNGNQLYLSVRGDSYPDLAQKQALQQQSVSSQAQWMGGNGLRPDWAQQPQPVSPQLPQEQYIQPPLQQRPAPVPVQRQEASTLNQPPTQHQSPPKWPIASQQGATPPVPTFPSVVSGVNSATDRHLASSNVDGPERPNQPMGGDSSKQQKSFAGKSTVGDAGVEYDEEGFEETYPETTNGAALEADETPTQTDPPKKKVHKHHKHDHQPTGPQSSDGTNEASGPHGSGGGKKKKKLKTIKKDKVLTVESESAGAASPIVHEHFKALHQDLEIEFADHDGYADRPGGAMLSLTLGVLLTAAMGILLSCRMRVARRRVRRPGKSSYAHDADFLVNGMYL